MSAQDTGVNHKAWLGTGWQPGWESASPYGGAVVASWGPDRLDVFGVADPDLSGTFSMYHTWWTGTQWASEALGGPVQGSAAAGSWGQNRLEVLGLNPG